MIEGRSVWSLTYTVMEIWPHCKSWTFSQWASDENSKSNTPKIQLRQSNTQKGRHKRLWLLFFTGNADCFFKTQLDEIRFPTSLMNVPVIFTKVCICWKISVASRNKTKLLYKHTKHLKYESHCCNCVCLTSFLHTWHMQCYRPFIWLKTLEFM